MSAIDAKAIVAALAASVGDGIWASEVQFFQGSRRCDFWTISPNSSAGFKARAYEVKISRADFRRDTHDKQRGARLFADQFFYATPVGLLKREEVPDWAGLVEFDGNQLRQIVPAPFLDKSAPSWELVVSLIRNSGELHRDQDLMKKRLHYLGQTIARVKEWCKANGHQPWQLGVHE